MGNSLNSRRRVDSGLCLIEDFMNIPGGNFSCKPRIKALDDFLLPLTVLYFDSQCAGQAARIRAKLEAAGTPVGPHDILIAATTLRHGATLITRNVREFARVPGLEWENWHEAWLVMNDPDQTQSR